MRRSQSAATTPSFEQWEEGFAALQKFHQREGHCRVLGGNREFGLNSPSGRVLREDVHEGNIAMRLWGHSSPGATGIENKVTTSALRIGPHLIPMRVQDETNTGFLQAPACGRFYISPAHHVLGRPQAGSYRQANWSNIGRKLE